LRYVKVAIDKSPRTTTLMPEMNKIFGETFRMIKVDIIEAQTYNWTKRTTVGV